MKKFLKIATAVILLISISCAIAGCSTKNLKKTEFADDKFIQSVAKGLEARWNLSDKNEDKETTVEMMKSYIQAELDQLTGYETAKFEDTKLQEKAIKYINCLKDSKEHIEYYFSDKTEDNNKWQKIYDTRTLLIKDFAENYNLTVSGKYQSYLDEFIANGKTVETETEEKEAIEGLVSALEFKVTKDEYGYKTYKAILNNTTDYNIKTLCVEINLLDKNGVIINTTSVYAENVKKGQKAYMEFSTDDKFDKMELILDYYEIEE